MNPVDESGEARAGIPVVVNPSAGRRDARTAERVRHALDGANRTMETLAGDSIDAQVGAAKSAHAPIVGVAGGDGTARTAANALVGSSTVLAMFPTGTLNHFSRRIGLHTVEDTADAIAEGRIQRIAVGMVEDEVFLNTATFGLYADVVRKRERLRGWLGKWPAALVGFMIAIARYRPIEVTLEIGGRSIVRRTALVWVGLGYGSFPVVPEASERRTMPDLEVAILRARNRPQLFALGARTSMAILRGRRPFRDDAVEIMHTRSFVLHSEHRIGITLDGEIVHGREPLHVTVRDDALRAVVGTSGGQHDQRMPEAERRRVRS